MAHSRDQLLLDLTTKAIAEELTKYKLNLPKLQSDLQELEQLLAKGETALSNNLIDKLKAQIVALRQSILEYESYINIEEAKLSSNPGWETRLGTGADGALNQLSHFDLLKKAVQDHKFQRQLAEETEFRWALRVEIERRISRQYSDGLTIERFQRKQAEALGPKLALCQEKLEALRSGVDIDNVTMDDAPPLLPTTDDGGKKDTLMQDSGLWGPGAPLASSEVTPDMATLFKMLAALETGVWASGEGQSHEASENPQNSALQQFSHWISKLQITLQNIQDSAGELYELNPDLADEPTTPVGRSFDAQWRKELRWLRQLRRYESRRRSFQRSTEGEASAVARWIGTLIDDIEVLVQEQRSYVERNDKTNPQLSGNLPRMGESFVESMLPGSLTNPVSPELIEIGFSLNPVRAATAVWNRFGRMFAANEGVQVPLQEGPERSGEDGEEPAEPVEPADPAEPIEPAEPAEDEESEELNTQDLPVIIDESGSDSNSESPEDPEPEDAPVSPPVLSRGMRLRAAELIYQARLERLAAERAALGPNPDIQALGDLGAGDIQLAEQAENIRVLREQLGLEAEIDDREDARRLEEGYQIFRQQQEEEGRVEESSDIYEDSEYDCEQELARVREQLRQTRDEVIRLGGDQNEPGRAPDLGDCEEQLAQARQSFQRQHVAIEQLQVELLNEQMEVDGFTLDIANDLPPGFFGGASRDQRVQMAHREIARMRRDAQEGVQARQEEMRRRAMGNQIPDQNGDEFVPTDLERCVEERRRLLQQVEDLLRVNREVEAARDASAATVQRDADFLEIVRIMTRPRLEGELLGQPRALLRAQENVVLRAMEVARAGEYTDIQGETIVNLSRTFENVAIIRDANNENLRLRVDDLLRGRQVASNAYRALQQAFIETRNERDIAAEQSRLLQERLTRAQIPLDPDCPQELERARNLYNEQVAQNVRLQRRVDDAEQRRMEAVGRAERAELERARAIAARDLADNDDPNDLYGEPPGDCPTQLKEALDKYETLLDRSRSVGRQLLISDRDRLAAEERATRAEEIAKKFDGQEDCPERLRAALIERDQAVAEAGRIRAQVETDAQKNSGPEGCPEQLRRALASRDRALTEVTRLRDEIRLRWRPEVNTLRTGARVNLQNAQRAPAPVDPNAFVEVPGLAGQVAEIQAARDQVVVQIAPRPVEASADNTGAQAENNNNAQAEQPDADVIARIRALETRIEELVQQLATQAGAQEARALIPSPAAAMNFNRLEDDIRGLEQEVYAQGDRFDVFHNQDLDQAAAIRELRDRIEVLEARYNGENDAPPEIVEQESSPAPEEPDLDIKEVVEEAADDADDDNDAPSKVSKLESSPDPEVPDQDIEEVREAASDDDEDDDDPPFKRRGRGATQAKKTKGKGKKTKVVEEDTDDYEKEDDNTPPSKKKGKGKAPVKTPQRKTPKGKRKHTSSSGSEDFADSSAGAGPEALGERRRSGRSSVNQTPNYGRGNGTNATPVSLYQTPSKKRKTKNFEDEDKDEEDEQPAKHAKRKR